MNLIILIVIAIGIYGLHKDHVMLAEGLDKIIEHLSIEEEEE